ncbi:MAG: uroporphyrinogen-III synthase [Rhodoferax sp.]|nr:uroporphyrinogen-III synthase [Rhodoferax sp.]
MRVIVTRPAVPFDPWVAALRQAGHDALALPLLEIAPPADTAAVTTLWQRLHGFDVLMFVSANAVRHFFALCPDNGSGPVLRNREQRCFATGPGTVAALLAAGVSSACVDAPPADAAQLDSEALWAVVQQRVCQGTRVLIVRGQDTTPASQQETGTQETGTQDSHGTGRDWFAAWVLENGGRLEYLVAYQRRTPLFSAAALALAQEAAADGSVWLFSSSQALANLCAVLPTQSWQRARALTTHPRIAQAARQAGFASVNHTRPTLDALLASIESRA